MQAERGRLRSALIVGLNRGPGIVRSDDAPGCPVHGRAALVLVDDVRSL